MPLPEPEPTNEPSLLERIQNLNNPAWVSRKAFGGGKMVKDKILGLVPTLGIKDPQLARQVAGQEFAGVRLSGPPGFAKLVGEGAVAVFSEQSTHKRIRLILSKSFGPEAVQNYIPKIQRTAKKVIEDASNSESEVKAEDMMSRYAFSVIVQLVVPVDLKSEAIDELQSAFRDILQGLFTLFPYDLPFLPFSKALRSREKIARFVQEQVDVARETSGPVESSETFIHRLVNSFDDDGNGLSDQEIVDNTLSILSAGLDTTACALTNILLLLSDNPGAWEKMRAEQEELLAQHGPSIANLSVQRMSFTDAVVKEGLRMFPPASATSMRVATKDLELDGHLVPKDLTILYMLSAMIQDDPRWKDLPQEDPFHPDRFAPERHLTEEGSKQGNMVYFGLGPRTCPGQYLSMVEQKIFLSELSRNWDFAATAGDREHSTFPLPFPTNGLPVKIKPRRSS